MKSRLILSVAAASLAFAASSCTPWVEPNPPLPPNGDPSARRDAPDLDEQERMRAKREEAKRREADARNATDGPTAINQGPETTGRTDLPPADPEPKPKPTATAPTAMKVPGKPGMVFSPFNNKIIDVQGMPSGKLVADPMYPPSEKKYFRVP